MSCEHTKHEGDECYHCGATAWLCVSDLREQRDDARALNAELKTRIDRDTLIDELRAALLESTDDLYDASGLRVRIDALLERTKP